MVMNKPRTSFGVSAMTAVNRTTKLPYGMVKVVQTYDPTMEREQVDLFGGSNPNAWDSADGNISNDIALSVSEFKPFLYTLAGYSVTESAAAEASGNVGTLTNDFGTSVVDSDTGIASVALSTSSGNGVDNLKEGRYMVSCSTGVAVVHVYALVDNDFTRGTDETYSNDTLRITTSALTITTGDTINVPAIGVALQAATGTIGMTVGDVAYFDVRKPNEGYNQYSFGENPVPVEFDMWLVSQKKSNNEFVMDRYPRVKLNSVPAGMATKEWANVDLSIKVLYDNTLGYAHYRYDTVQDL